MSPSTSEHRELRDRDQRVPRAERRMFRIAAWMWQTPLRERGLLHRWPGSAGERPERKRGPHPRRSPSYRLIDPAPATVKARSRSCPSCCGGWTRPGGAAPSRVGARSRTVGGRIEAADSFRRIDSTRNRRSTTSGGFDDHREHSLHDRRVRPARRDARRAPRRRVRGARRSARRWRTCASSSCGSAPASARADDMQARGRGTAPLVDRTRLRLARPRLRAAQPAARSRST